jgi:hypothetical protein
MKIDIQVIVWRLKFNCFYERDEAKINNRNLYYALASKINFSFIIKT